MLSSLKSNDIENVVIFVCDALRWDYTPQHVIDLGVCYKTIASSLYTASSFPSMISGLYPPKTGVFNWDDVIPPYLRGLFEIDGYNTSLWCETTWTNLPPDKSAIHKILCYPKGVSLEKIEPPFIFIEDDKGGHCPFGFSFSKYEDGGCNAFFKEYGKKGIAELIHQYVIGIKQSVERFYSRLYTLKERNLIEKTLIIFTSDHGELLGEYGGLTHHNQPPCPELVYVPTIFIHPSLKPDFQNGKLFRHVDLYPTIMSILDKDLNYEVDGVDITSNPFPSKGLNFRLGGYKRTQSKIKKMLEYESSSIWDYNGGHIFHGLDKKKAYMLFIYKLMIQKHPEFNFLRENLKYNSNQKLVEYKKTLRYLCSKHIKFLNPYFSKQQAKNIIDNYLIESKDFKEKNRVKRAIFGLRKKGFIK